VFSWGNTRDAELGYVANQPVESPQINTLLSRLNPTHIALGQRGTFVIDGEGRLWSCGSHTRPQNDVKSFLGHAESSLALVEGLESERFIQVSATSHVLAVTLQGEVYSWGSNSYKQLGRDGVNNRPMKITALEGEEVVQVCAGGHHSAAVSKAGNLYTWGRGGYGRLGHGTSDDVNVPTRVAAFPEGIRVVHVACGLGDAHSMCVTEDGHIYSFGDGDFGKLGHGTNDRRRQPERIDFDIVKVVCGSSTSAAISLSGALYVWGGGRRYRLGTGTEAVIWQPRTAHALNTHKVVDCALSSEHGVAVTDRGEVFVWGANDHGQLGADAGSEKTIIAPRVIKLPGEFPAVNRVHCFPYGTLSWSPSRLSDAHETIKAAPAVYQHLQGVDVDALRRRAYILEYASSLLLPLLPFFELNVQALGGREPSLALGGSAEGLRTLQSYIAFGHKERLLKSILQRTTETTARVTITLNRVQIQRTPEGLAGPDGSQSVFAQAARELRSVDQSVFLASSRCWKVKFRGEGLDDAGGGFSESISEMCEELRNHSVPLLIPTPNGRDEAGDNRDAFLLNPTSDSAYHLQLFEFLGTLIGIAIRTSSPITLQLAPCVWRLIAGLNLTIGDLKEVAANYVATLEFITVSPADVFEQCDFPTTTPSSLEGVDYQVVPGARLTLARRDEYVRRSLELRLHEFDRQVAAIRRGLARVVPLPVISLFSADQLESLVSGGQHFDLELLRWMTKYKNCEASSHHVSWFWETMAAMTPEEHSLFLRFVWGRTRLPRTEADFAGNQFKLQASLGGADAALPEALTCFFLLKLPRYSSQQVMSRKLRYAITHCKAIDSDAYARTNLADEAPAA
ncbi:uncharacterized protein MONBRDRAFT_55, partial [Monosiga brevicollis MX1]